MKSEEGGLIRARSASEGPVLQPPPDSTAQPDPVPEAIIADEQLPAFDPPPSPNDALTPPDDALTSTDAVAAQPAADVDVIDPNAALETALASLSQYFEELLADLLDSARTALRLPDPSEPQGNGRAYEKFLTLYNQLRGLSPEVNEVG